MASDMPNPEELDISDELIAERPGHTPKDMTPWQRHITAFIDVPNYRAGQFFALLMVPLFAVVVYEVLSRNIDAILRDAEMGWVGLEKPLALALPCRSMVQVV